MQKLIKVVSISSNANSFGLKGHVLVAKDGEAWEVGRSAYTTEPYKVGDIITVEYPDTMKPEARSPLWYRGGFEIPRKLDTCPPKLLKQFWPDDVPACIGCGE